MKTVQFFLFSFLCIHLSCVDKIDFERPDSIKNGLSIQGKIIKGNPSKVSVILREVFDFFRSARDLSAVGVYILDEKGNELALKTKQQGHYNLEIEADHPFFKIEYGQKYKLYIKGLKGNDYESDFDELTPVPTLNTLEARETIFETKDRFGNVLLYDRIGFFINTPLSKEGLSENSQILWELNGVAKITDTPNAGKCNVRRNAEPKACYVSYPPFRNYITFNGKTSSSDQLNDFLLTEINYTNLFAEGYYLEVYQQSVSQAAFDHWSQIGIAVNRTGDFFQEPAGKISSNIKNINNPDEEVYGFFYATEQSIKRVYISPEFGKKPARQCPQVSMSGENSARCCNCLNFEISTAQKPDWWIE